MTITTPPRASRCIIIHVIFGIATDPTQYGDAARDPARHGGLAAARTIVIEEEAATGIYALCILVIQGDPLEIVLCHSIAGSGMEGYRPLSPVRMIVSPMLRCFVKPVSQHGTRDRWKLKMLVRLTIMCVALSYGSPFPLQAPK
jgi:hypothetical protein